jgi:hypothetical protein
MFQASYEPLRLKENKMFEFQEKVVVFLHKLVNLNITNV